MNDVNERFKEEEIKNHGYSIDYEFLLSLVQSFKWLLYLSRVIILFNPEK